MKFRGSRGYSWILAPHLFFCAVLIAGCGDETKQVPVPPAHTDQSSTESEAEPTQSDESLALPPPPNVAWRTYHGNTSLDGVADIAFPDALERAWMFDAGAAIPNPPVSADGRIFFSNLKGTIFALDMTGKEVWSKSFKLPVGNDRPPRTVYFDAPLLLIDSTLVAGSSAGALYALDAATGDERWKCETDVPILGSPTYADVEVDGKMQRRVYVIDEAEGALQCIDFQSGELLWKGPPVQRCDGSPAVNGAVAVYGSCAAAIHVFSAIDGKLLRETPLDDDSQVAGGVVLLGDSVYSGSRSGMFVHMNVQTGDMVWTNKDCEGESYSTPAIDATTIVYGANDGALYALDRASGTLKWKQDLDDTPNSPIIARDKVIVTAAGDLYLLRLADGEKLWSYSVSDFVVSPSVAGALILVGSDDGSLTAFAGKEPAQS